MGRSQLTTTHKVRRLTAHHFGDFRRALMGADMRAFDRLVAAAKNNRMAISQSRDVLPVTAMLLTMIVDLQVQLIKLQKKLEKMEGEIGQKK